MGAQYDEAIRLSSICRAIKECKRGVSYKDGPMSWYVHSYTKGKELKDDIVNKRYKLRPGTVVKIFRPKKREAVAPWFRDRVWQRSMCNSGLYDDLTRSLCYDNYACQTGKGTDLAIRRTIHAMQRIYRTTRSNEGWAVHIDIRKYFPSTPHRLLKELDEKIVSEPMFRPYLTEIIDSIKDPRTPEEIAQDPFGERGTGLGSQINQLHQVALIDALDHELRKFCTFSERYMDDFLIIDADKEICIRAERVISEWLEKMGLQSVNKSGLIPLSEGFYFLRKRFILTETGKVIVKLHPETLKLERVALRGLKRALDRGETTMEYIQQHYQCFIAQAEYASGDGAIRAMDKYYTKLFRQKPVYKRKRRYFHGHHQECKKGALGGAQKERGASGKARKGAGEGPVPRAACG